MRVRWVGRNVSFVVRFWRNRGRDKRDGPPSTSDLRDDVKREESVSSG